MLLAAAHLCEVTREVHLVELNLAGQPPRMPIRQRAVAHLRDDGQQAPRRFELTARSAQVQVRRLRLDQEVDQRLRGGERTLPAGRVAPHQLVRVFVWGQTHDGDLGVPLFLEAHHAAWRTAPRGRRAAGRRTGYGHHDMIERLLRHRDAAHHGVLARRVWIERQRDTARQLLDLLDVFVGDGAADAGHDIAVAVLMQHDGIQVALDDDDAVVATNGVAREVQPEERRALIEEDGLRRVEIFDVPAAQLARAKGDGLAAAVAYREDHAVAEVIVQAAAAIGLALAAAKARPGAVLGRDVEGGGALAMKRAQTLEGLARLFQRDDRTDLLNDVELLLDALDNAAGLGQIPLLLSRATGAVRSMGGLLVCNSRNVSAPST